MAEESNTRFQDSMIVDSPCTYIPDEIFNALTAVSIADTASNDLSALQNTLSGETRRQNALPAPPIEVVPSSFQGESLAIKAESLVELMSEANSSGPRRMIFDMQFASGEDHLPGVLMRSEGDPLLNVPGNSNVDTCYAMFGIAYEFFRKIFRRDSIDGNGIPLVGIVNYGFYFPNATWSVSKANMQHVIVFGNGWDNDAFNGGLPRDTWTGMFGGFVNSLEVVVHEMMHGVTRSYIKLQQFGEPGGLDEHISDVFGIMAEQWHKKQTVDQADWLVGEDCLVPEKKGFALRSFADPGSAYDFKIDNLAFQGFAKDPQTSHWNVRFKGSEDKYGVHINSGIPNKAFYLLAKRLGGYSWEKAGQIWYQALTSGQIPSNCTYSVWAQQTINAAKNEPKLGQSVADEVKRAWADVGITMPLKSNLSGK